jgi:hypothetical protein
MAVVLREDVNDIILAMHEEEIIEVDAGSVDVRRPASVDMADRERRVGRRDLIEVVEQRGVSIPWLVIE